ncbi:MAG: hypothetical protein Q8R20_01480 [Nanoarchaeota archaeon]|nr:hypothetical protein [Nanoarchaeota archaeon]
MMAKRDVSAIRTHLVEGEIFALTIDLGAPESDPIAMVLKDGYDPERWKFTGVKLVGVHTRRFRLVSVGYCRDLDEVRQKLAEHGTPAEGQWREAFRKAYPTPDKNGPIGFADSSWVDPGGYAVFPYVWTRGGSGFRWTLLGFDGLWRWVVAVSE